MIKVIHPKFKVKIILKEKVLLKICNNVKEVKEFTSKCKKDMNVLYVRTEAI